MNNKILAWYSISLGWILICAEVVRNFGNWQWWPFWLVDFIAAILLIYGGVRTLRLVDNGLTVLCGAWGFTCGMAYMSFWSHVKNINEVADGNIPHLPLTILIGLGLVLSIVGFISSAMINRKNSNY